ncbi:hypothetical protein NCTGTJJY_CDS0134 [Serratia phage 92A1]|nr:hypothetical protein NCTGTJJY_CDS0134 [Serratia phage 92A1]
MCDKCKCKFKICKNCKATKLHEWFKDSENSDDGKFPICVKCTKRLKRIAEDRYDGYLKSASRAPIINVQYGINYV